MAKLFPARGAQRLQCSEFIYNYNDTAVDSVTGAVKTFGSVYTDAIVFDCINLPTGAQVVGGDFVIEAAGVGPTAYTMKLGIAGDDACYLAANDLTAAANTRTALLLTKALSSNTGKNVRMTIASTVANATAGKFRITVLWKIDGKADEATGN